LRRIPTVFVVFGAVAAVAAAITGAATPLPALQFVAPGHWVYSAVLSSAVHVDGATGSVDAGVQVTASSGSQVVQGQDKGYVVDSGHITVFGKSDLNVEGSMAAPANEQPLTMEGAGGPYLVYRQAGKVTRLGERPATVTVGGPLADPVLTGDGTMWLLRKDNGRVCELRSTSDTVTFCPAETPAGHTGALSLVSGQPSFVDTSEGKLYPVGEKGFGPAATLGGPTGANIRPSATDVSGRVVLLDPDQHTLSVVDPKASAPPVTVKLPKGDYTEPAVGGSVITVVERTTGTVLTYDDQGRQRDHQEMPKGSGKPRLTRGDDNHVYVEGDKGTHVMVIGEDGDVDDVPLDRAPARPDTEPDKPNKQDEDNSVVPPPTGHEHDERGDEQKHEQQQPPPEEPERKKVLPPVGGQDPTPPPEHHEPPAPPVVPASPPGTPTGVRADAGSGSATVHWSAAQDNGSAITGYHLTWKSSAGNGSRDVGASAGSAKVSGLTDGTSYTFSVAAKNKAGRGSAASAKVVTPAAIAGPPGVLPIYDDSNGNALVNWSAPADMGGGTLVHYTVDATGMQQRTATGTSLLVTNLPHDGRAITFTVRAITRTSTGQLLTGAPGTFTWPGSSGGGGGGGGPTAKITRGEEDCPDHEDEPTCAKMHVALSGFEPNTEYDITPHSSNDDYHADDAHYTTDDDGSVSFDTFQYYWVGDDVWVSVCVDDDNSVDSNHMKWTAS
jgi:hypothetical protein